MFCMRVICWTLIFIFNLCFKTLRDSACHHKKRSFNKQLRKPSFESGTLIGRQNLGLDQNRHMSNCELTYRG